MSLLPPIVILMNNSTINNIDLQYITAIRPPTTTDTLALDLDQIKADNISITGTDLHKVNFRFLTINGRIGVYDDIATFTVKDVTSANFDISQRVGHLTINSANVAGTIRLSGDGPNKSADPLDDIMLANIACRELQFGSARYIGKAKISNVSCSAVDIGNEPGQILDTMDTNPVDSPFYHSIAQTYINNGKPNQARSVLFALADREAREKTGYDYYQQQAIKWITGYGLYPERGFLFILAAVVVASVIFWRGEKSSTKVFETYPQALFFTMDSVIPLIDLNDEFKKKEFDGYRQYFLYVMRILSTVVVFFVFEFFKQRIIGPG
jgi:hypothetical protein